MEIVKIDENTIEVVGTLQTIKISDLKRDLSDLIENNQKAERLMDWWNTLTDEQKAVVRMPVILPTQQLEQQIAEYEAI